jgi:hypothetical protein
METGYLLNENGSAPPWPHIICHGDANGDGAGWAWCLDVVRRPCFSGESANASAKLVADAINGAGLSGIDRMLAVVALRHETGSGFSRLFRDPCPACDGDHYKRAERLLSAERFIQAAAIPFLRVANVPEWLLREPFFRRPGDEPLPATFEELKRMLDGADDQKRRKVKRRWKLSKNIPVWVGDPDRTKMSQIRFAQLYASRRGVSLDAVSRTMSQSL